MNVQEDDDDKTRAHARLIHDQQAGEADAQRASAARVFLTTIVMTTMKTQSIATNAAALMLEMG